MKRLTLAYASGFHSDVNHRGEGLYGIRSHRLRNPFSSRKAAGYNIDAARSGLSFPVLSAESIRFVLPSLELGHVSFPLLLAHWPAALGYVAASAGVFWWLRRTARADLPSPDRTERPQTTTTLFPAAVSFFRLASPLLLAGGSVATWGLRIAIGQWHWADVLVVLGVVALWPLQEWLLHVCLLHLKPVVVLGLRIDPLVARSHRRHHCEPWDAAGGVTPPFIIWLYLAGLPAVWLPFLPTGPALTGMALYFTLALYYEWIHYLIHTPYVPRTWLYRRLWRNHRLHHFQNEHYWFGVTMLSADWLLDTQPAIASTARSETCRTLGVETAGVPGGADSIDR